ncbi:hypothetical protein [Mesorhizobium sp.]|uniref:hypothetical protein n=1 Tax=Mesorhizobium sp. TaxID=1871066 RepID=UPI000FEA8F82|nr:hypothetical protein [Mesorhizobium sp.]RWB65990.1 MAG: hypothetical protein EOQ49_30375 [Mesorhizobium sp.]RWF16787.1 MAG: hypothetical protein EOS64_24455 [Mesorhizobium sp.]TIT10749.1 MAG: hypothetical protein E5W74_15435 [Mesorhizobium sp.]TIV82858.1 MAG: hypothetical protein E5V64_10460 [Mesorhizobium sp.]
MPHHGFARPEQLEMLSKALAELGGHFPPDSPEGEALAAKIMALFESGTDTLEEIKKALNDRDATP